MKKINILGVNISHVTRAEILAQIEKYLAGKEQYYIVTPNPEIILEAQHDEEFFYILNKADLSILDGFGLKLASLMSFTNIRRFTGADLVIEILRTAERDNKKVLIFNWHEGLSNSREITDALNNKFPALKLSILNTDREGKQADLAAAQKFSPDVMITTLGAPFQEKFIYHNLHKIPSAKISIGIGGALDFITGKAKRAPKAFRVLGIEWLWRLLQQRKVEGKQIFFYKRLRRIFRAVVIFPWKFFVWRYILPFFYRPNVACMLYKKENSKYKFLILERNGQPGHWQLPQGGTDNESIVIAGARELREELGTDKFETRGAFKNIWSYTFKQSDRGRQGSWGYKGQRQGLYIAEYLGSDEEIKINYWDHSAWRWVRDEDLLTDVYPSRRESVKIFMEKFQSLKNI